MIGATRQPSDPGQSVRRNIISIQLPARLMAAALGLALLASIGGVAQADSPLALKRGISMELWTTWPAESEWGKAEVLFPFPEWRRQVGELEFSRLKSDGFDFVRLPIDPGVFASPVSAPMRDRLLEEIDAAAAMIRAAGLNVLLDLHSIPGGDARQASIETITGSTEAFERHISLAETFARRYGGRDGFALELINEPVLDCETPVEDMRWPQMMERLHKAARAAAPAMTLVATGACWGDASMLRHLTKPVTDDPLTLFSFHSYAPFLLTHQGAGWAGDIIRHVTGLPYPPDRYGAADFKAALRGAEAAIERDAPAMRRAAMIDWLRSEAAMIDTPQELRAAMLRAPDEAAAFADERGIGRDRMLMGEFGMIRQEWENPFVMPAEWRRAYIVDKRKMVEERGFGWAVWGYSGAFGIYQAFGGEALQDKIID
jgi:endoglucanase